MLSDRARGFTKEAASIGRSMLAGAAKLVKKPAVWKGGLAVGGGVALGAYGHKQMQRQDPIEPGSLTREKRRSEMDRFGSL